MHLINHDVSYVRVSRAPIEKLLAYKRRMGWTAEWVSSWGSDFNFDYRRVVHAGRAQRQGELQLHD